MKRRLLLFLILVVSISLQTLAQYVQGLVVDDATGEPLPGAHVYYLDDKSTMQITDINGRFKIAVRNSNLYFSMIGFQSKLVAINGSQRLTIRLKDTSTDMNEVEIKVKKQKYSRKNNPAVEMMKKVIAAKDSNDYHRNNFFSYSKYEKMTFSLNEFTDKVFQDDHFKKFPQLKEHVEYCKETGKLILPLIVREEVSRHIYRKNPESEKDIIDGRREEGVQEMIPTDMFETTIFDLVRNIDIYRNDIRFMQQEFVSPISTNSAIGYYRYFIVDTLEISGTKCYQLDFTPNNSYDVGFSGALFIMADSTWRIKRAEISVPKMSNINYIDQLDLFQDFITLPSGEHVLESSKMIAQMKLANWIQKVQLERSERFRDYATTPIDRSVFKFNGNKKVDSNAEMRDEAFWEGVRPEPLTKTESRMELFMQRLSNIPGFKQILWVAKAFIFNYIETNMDPRKPSKFDYGPVNTTFAYNKIEGFKLRASGMTTAALSPHHFAEGYLGYGFRDKQFKGKAKYTYSFNEKRYLPFEYPVNNLSTEISYDVVTATDNFIDTDKDNIVTALKWTSLDHQFYRMKFNVMYDREWENGIRFTTGFTRERMEAAGNLFFQHTRLQDGEVSMPSYPYGKDGKIDYDALENSRRYVVNTEFSARFEWQPGVTWLNTHDRRRKTNFDSPMFSIAHYTGIKGLFGGSFNSNMTAIELSKRFWMRSWGRVDIYMKAQKQWNQVPFMFLPMPPANYSYIIQDHTFHLIDNYEFLTDQNASLMLSWEMNGKLFNRIPGIRKLKIHEYIGANFFWGYLSDRNNPFLAQNAGTNLMYFPGRYTSNGFEYNYQPLNPSEPYIELIAGIHNIFKLIHIEYVHRMNYLRSNTQRWGIRFTFRLYM